MMQQRGNSQAKILDPRESTDQSLGNETTRSHPYQDNSPGGGLQPVWETFKERLPQRPYCADDPSQGVLIRTRKFALLFPLIQLNGPSLTHCMTFDIDRPDAALAFEDVDLPAPNIVSENPKNGHAHLSYALERPVWTVEAARVAPLQLLAAVDHGITKRLSADPGYSGLLAKNPFTSHWRTRWIAPLPYSLTELAGWLETTEMRRPRRREEQAGLGRNCSLFDDLRHVAYGCVLKFKNEGRSYAEFHSRLRAVAESLNSSFPLPLSPREVAAIVKSVARWTWAKFSPESFSRIQAKRRSAIVRKRMEIIEELDR